MNQPPYGQQPYGQQPYPQQPGYTPGVPGAPPPKKGMSGCLIAFLVVLGLFVVGGGIAAFVVYRMIGAPIKEMMAVVQEGTTAPGTDELRSSGCQTASAMDAAKLMKVVKEFGEKLGADQQKLKDMDDKQLEAPTIVVCELKPSTTLSCDDVAHTYESAAHPKDKFSVIVKKTHAQSNECAFLYDAEGKKLGDAKGAAAVNINTPSN
jgi:hypothetical protein